MLLIFRCISGNVDISGNQDVNATIFGKIDQYVIKTLREFNKLVLTVLEYV